MTACGTTANVTVGFGGRNWPISEDDFRLARLNANDCLGAFFQFSSGHSAPSWIVGDTFLVSLRFRSTMSCACVTILFFKKEKCILGVSVQPAFGRVCAAFGRGAGRAESTESAGADSDDWISGADCHCDGTKWYDELG